MKDTAVVYKTKLIKKLVSFACWTNEPKKGEMILVMAWFTTANQVWDWIDSISSTQKRDLLTAHIDRLAFWSTESQLGEIFVASF